MGVIPGTKLGPFEIQALLGAGGMGEVYRAVDTRLDRTVAIKVLNSSLASSPELKHRFEREARAISALQHPNICVLYDIGNENGTAYLVMEYLEGESLAERLQQGALPIDQALKIAIEIAEALDKAHRAGIVHRDLKPGNIMLTKSGAKLLDFGLAKPVSVGAAAGAASVPSFSAVATVTSPSPQMPLTSSGALVGTIQYMTPEQLQGIEADARSDIFAFGAVLYEMTTGQRAFPGKSQIKVASAILEDDPPQARSLRDAVSPELDHIVELCLKKDPNHRLGCAHDLKLQLESIRILGARSQSQPVTAWRGRLPLTVLSVFALLMCVVAIGLWQPWRNPQIPAPMHLIADVGTSDVFAAGNGNFFAISPDGSRLAFVAEHGPESTQLYIRNFDQPNATPLADTEEARNPFFSPDGKWIGFFSRGRLKKISILGGVSVSICNAVDDRGGTWGDDGNIVFSGDPKSGLSIVTSGGGEPAALTTLDGNANEATHRWPQLLPGGQEVLYTVPKIGFAEEDTTIQIYSFASRKVKTVVRGYYARYLPSGYLIYVHNSTLFSVPFDLNRLEVTGPAVPIIERVLGNPGTAVAQVSISNTGTLVYLSGNTFRQEVSIDWLDHQGRFQPLQDVPGAYYNPRFSPDGKKLAYDLRSASVDIWVYDLARHSPTRLTFEGASVDPTWTPDGQRITYFRATSGLFWKRADGSGTSQQITDSKYREASAAWRPDGRVLAFQQLNPNSGWDIMTVTAELNEKLGWKFSQPQPLLNSRYNEVAPVFSPDGRWLAYSSDESGHFEVYVRPFPGPGGKRQISSDGGFRPVWSRDGRQLFYETLPSPGNLAERTIMVARYEAAKDSFNADTPKLWASAAITGRQLANDYDLHPEGKRFVVLKAPEKQKSEPLNKINVIFNFPEELRRKISGK